MLSRVVFSVLALVVAGCSSPESSDYAVRPRTMKVEWFGHQSFLITSSLGNKMLTNPYWPGIAARQVPSGLKPDVVLITHEGKESSNTDVYDNFPVVFRGSVGMGMNNAAGTRIRGVPVFENPSDANAMKMSLVFTWVSDNIKYCFVGDPAGPLTPSHFSQIGTVDVLFLNAGGRMSASTRNSLVNALRPRLIIPMGKPGAIASWAASQSRVHRVSGSTVLLNKEALPFEPTTLVFNP